MKNLLALMLFSLVDISAYACDVCEKQQPAIIRGITHGAGPESNWDYLIVSVAAIIVVGSLFYSIKWLLSPEETDENHIKRIVLSYELNER